MTIAAPVEAYPLAWPAGAPRTPENKRRSSSFAKITHEMTTYGKRQKRTPLTVFAEINRVRAEVNRIAGASGLVISTNLPVRGDGMPRTDARPKGGDTGVAVYWSVRMSRNRVVPYVMPCDTYDDVADNLHAVALSIEAMRGLDRWGAVKLEQAFAGFAALPPGSGSAERPWRDVLGPSWPDGIDAEEMLAIAKARHRRMIQAAHPDLGGDPVAAAELNRAIEEAERELGAQA